MAETYQAALFAQLGPYVSTLIEQKQVRIPKGLKGSVSFKPGHNGDLVKVTISGWINALIKSAYEKVENDDVPHLTHRNFQARELRAMATSLAFHQYHSLKQIMEAASWRSDGMFASFYLLRLSPALLDPTLGPLVAAQAVVDNTTAI